MPEGFVKKEIYTIGELSSIISEVFSSELFMNIKVRGEIVSKTVKNGNVYLSMIDSDAKQDAKGKAILKVLIFSWYDQSIDTEYKEGDEVVVSGDMSYYAPFGSISLNAKSLYLYGEGLELIKLQKLKEKLEKEGLFAIEKKRPLPAHIGKIGIITSASGAAYHDICQTLERKFPVPTILFDALVQGAGAPASLIRALSRAYKSDCDVLIFGRGGGSKTDLSCFNDEALVRKLASSPIPVITGIGHEIDTSLCDLAADVYAITPTAAADKALPDIDDVKGRLTQDRANLDKAMDSLISVIKLNVVNLGYTLAKHSPEAYLDLEKSRFMDDGRKLSSLLANFVLIRQSELKNSLMRLNAAPVNIVLMRQSELRNIQTRLDAANPLSHLVPGMALIRKDGKGVKSALELKPGDQIEIGFSDGIRHAQIEKEEK